VCPRVISGIKGLLGLHLFSPCDVMGNAQLGLFNHNNDNNNTGIYREPFVDDQRILLSIVSTG